MKSSAFAYAAGLAAVLAVSACSTPASRDTGSMAFPAPLPQGTTGTTVTSGPNRPTDTGSMAFPAPRPQGQVGTSTVGTSRTPTDTGSMAFPAPKPQGQLGTTTIR